MDAPPEDERGSAMSLGKLADELEGFTGRLAQWLESAVEPPPRQDAKEYLQALRWLCSNLRGIALSQDPGAAGELAEHRESFQSLLRSVERQVHDASAASRAVADEMGGHVRELDAIADLGHHEAVTERLEGVLVAVRETATQFEAHVQTIAADIGSASREISALERELDEINDRTLRDELTGLGSRRALDAALGEAVCQGHKRGPWAFLLVDIDRLSDVNEAHGRIVGDALLVKVGHTIESALSEVGKKHAVGRFGGEEFGLLLRGTTARAAGSTAEGIRQCVASSKWTISGSSQNVLAATVSIGGTEYRPGDNLQAVIERAGQALRQAKTEGRNKAILHEADESTTLAARRAAMRGRA